MRPELLDRIPLICPRCRQPGGESVLALETVYYAAGGYLLEGLLHCPAPSCQAVYPVLDGVPVVLKNMADWWRDERSRLATTTGTSTELQAYFQALDATDPQHHERRCLLGTYMERHYGCGTPAPAGPLPTAEAYWDTVLALSTSGKPYHRALDLGCAVGRHSFELARHSELAVGLDRNFALVAAAAAIQRDGEVCYQRRLRGQQFATVAFPQEAARNVLFLVADALDPPLPAAAFDCVAALNLLDNVSVPLILLGQMDALLGPGGRLVLGSPYEWRHEFCDPAEWLENAELDAPDMIRRILVGELIPQLQLRYTVLEERAEIPWTMRQHERFQALFLVHLIVARKG